MLSICLDTLVSKKKYREKNSQYCDLQYWLFRLYILLDFQRHFNGDDALLYLEIEHALSV